MTYTLDGLDAFGGSQQPVHRAAMSGSDRGRIVSLYASSFVLLGSGSATLACQARPPEVTTIVISAPGPSSSADYAILASDSGPSAASLAPPSIDEVDSLLRELRERLGAARARERDASDRRCLVPLFERTIQMQAQFFADRDELALLTDTALPRPTGYVARAKELVIRSMWAIVEETRAIRERAERCSTATVPSGP